MRNLSGLAKWIGERRRAPVALSLVAHALLLAAATRLDWHLTAPAPRETQHVVWLDRSPFPERVNPLVPQARDEALNPPAPPESREPPPLTPVEPTRPRARRSQRAAPSSSPEPAAEPEPADVAPQQSSAPTIDFEAERARAVAAAVEAQASTATLRRPGVDELLAPPAPAAAPARHKPSIFDLGSGGSGGNHSFARPGQAKRAFARKLIDFCHALTGGFGVALQGHTFFSLCAKSSDEPTGLFPEVMPEYLKLKPECDPAPIGPLSPEARRFPTSRCRLVPKEGLPADAPQ